MLSFKDSPKMTRRDEKFFFLQNSKINSNTQNFDQSVVQDNKAIDFNKAPLDKDTSELVVDNYCNSNV